MVINKLILPTSITYKYLFYFDMEQLLDNVLIGFPKIAATQYGWSSPYLTGVTGM
jgi:hypothetical protein